LAISSQHGKDFIAENKDPWGSKGRSRRIISAAAFIFLTVIASLAVVYGVAAWVRKANPLIDVPSAEFQKTANATAVRIGDVFRVDIFIGWHGHVLPESTRHVKVVDPYPKGYFILVNGSNIYEYYGTGPGPDFTYLLEVVGGQGRTVQLPSPKFYLDGVEIPLSGTAPLIRIG